MREWENSAEVRNKQATEFSHSMHEDVFFYLEVIE